MQTLRITDPTPPSKPASRIDPSSMLPDNWNVARDVLLIVGEGACEIAQPFIDHGLQRVITMYPPPVAPEPETPGAIRILNRAELTETLRSFSTGYPKQYAVIITPQCSLEPHITQSIKERIGNLLLTLPGKWYPPWKLTNHWALNGTANQRNLEQLPMVQDIGDAFAGVPVVIVGSGPSLGKNIHLLKEAQDKCIILCVNRALRSLQREGIWPDIAINIETQDVECQFADIDLDRIPGLFLSSTSHPPLFDLKGPKIFSYAGRMKRQGWMFNSEKMATPTDGISVACAAMTVAIQLKCDPIILVGQDLSFAGGNYYHSNGADGDAKAVWDKVNNCWQLTNYSDDLAHTLKGNMPVDGPRYNATEVPGYYGGMVPTSAQFAGFRYFLQGAAVDHIGLIKMYNCTEGGARIGGMKHEPLQQALQRLPTRSIDVRAVLNEPRIEQMADARRPQIKEQFEKNREAVRLAYAQSKRVIEMIDESLQLGKLVAGVNQLASQLASNFIANHLVRLLAPHDLARAIDAERKATSTTQALQASRMLYSTMHEQLSRVIAADSTD